MAPRTETPPLLEWKPDSRSSLAGMRQNTVFVRLHRIATDKGMQYRVHVTFPLPRGVEMRELRFFDIDTAKKAAEGIFSKWLLAVHLAPRRPPSVPPEPKKKTS